MWVSRSVKLTLSLIICCVGLSVQYWPKRGKFMTDVERKKMIHLLLIKVKVSLKWVKCCWSYISPGFATVCSGGKDWLWHMMCHETLWRVWNWSWGDRLAVCKFIEIKLPEISPVKPLLQNLSVVEVYYQHIHPTLFQLTFFYFLMWKLPSNKDLRTLRTSQRFTNKCCT